MDTFHYKTASVLCLSESENTQKTKCGLARNPHFLAQYGSMFACAYACPSSSSKNWTHPWHFSICTKQLCFNSLHNLQIFPPIPKPELWNHRTNVFWKSPSWKRMFGFPHRKSERWEVLEKKTFEKIGKFVRIIITLATIWNWTNWPSTNEEKVVLEEGHWLSHKKDEIFSFTAKLIEQKTCKMK